MDKLRSWLIKTLGGSIEQKAENIRFEISGGRLVMPTDNKETYIREGYNVNDIIYSVINLILDKVRLPDWNIYQVVDEKKLKQRNKLLNKKDLTLAEVKMIEVLFKESLEPIDNFNLQQGKLSELLEYPNDLETFSEFFTLGCLYKLTTGDKFQYGKPLSAGANQGIPNSIENLPAQHMKIDINDSFPARPTQYELMVFNQKFRPEEILHEIYSNPNWNINGEQLYGFSPLRPFLKNIVRNNSAKEAAIAKYQNGGTEELIYMDEPRFTPEQGIKQAEAVKAKLMSREHRGPQAQGKIAVSGIKMGSVKLGLSPVELGIIDSEKWDAIMFCNGFGVPPELLGLTQKTFNNMKEAEKALTTRSALPLLECGKYSLNRKLQTDWGFKGKNVWIDYETEMFTELQADQGETATWLDKVIMIKPDEQRELLNMDALNTTESQEVWVKTSSGYQPLSDFQANEVDNILNSINDAVNGTQSNGVRSNGRANIVN